MNIILLSGGSGKRLWPLSNDVRSKQFIKIFKKPEHNVPMGTEYSGDYESMVQRIYRQIKTVDDSANVIIATSKSQVSAIHNQLGMNVGISVEPCRRDTFAAIALATAYLHDVKGVPADEAVVVCPVDPYVEDGYFETIRSMCNVAQSSDKNLVLMGIEPTYPSEKYGYIKPVRGSNGDGEKAGINHADLSCSDGGDIARQECVRGLRYTFTEKPTAEKAAEYIAEGALWNGGVFAYKLEYVLRKSEELLGTSKYESLFNGYSDLRKISFDYAVVEQETSLEVIKYSGTWKDLGTWNTLTEAMEGNTVGDVRMNDECENVHAINGLDVPMIVMGGKDLVVAASPEGILVSDKNQSSYIKPFVDEIDQQIMFAEKSWGSYRVLDVDEDSLTVKVTLNPGHRMNYHSHEKRDEVWTVQTGTGFVIIDGVKRSVKPGDMISMPAGCKHTAMAGDDTLQIVEVQLGTEIIVSDKKKYEWLE